jgi:hypothetical protein
MTTEPKRRGRLPKYATEEERKKAKREVSRKWHAANREKAKEASRKWYAANSEKAKERARKWHAANREKANETTRKWYAERAAAIAAAIEALAVFAWFAQLCDGFPDDEFITAKTIKVKDYRRAAAALALLKGEKK